MTWLEVKQMCGGRVWKMDGVESDVRKWICGGQWA